jgi:hypothetical protein
MAFVRRKKTKRGTATYSLVENVRQGGRVRQKVLAYLGPYPSVAAARGKGGA